MFCFMELDSVGNLTAFQGKYFINFIQHALFCNMKSIILIDGGSDFRRAIDFVGSMSETPGI